MGLFFSISSDVSLHSHQFYERNFCSEFTLIILHPKEQSNPKVPQKTIPYPYKNFLQTSFAIKIMHTHIKRSYIKFPAYIVVNYSKLSTITVCSPIY